MVHIGGLPGGLLAYLAIGRGSYYSRSELVSTLWADRADTLDTGKLNTALWRLRKLVERPPLKPGDLIACDRRGAVGLHPNAQIELDVEVFVSRVVPVLHKPIETTTETDIIELREGIKLYSADILTDFSDEWALREREKYRRHYLNALGRLMYLSAIRQEWDDGIRYAQAILDNDALREDVHRDLMRMFVQGGQRAMALRQFEICRSALKRELAIQPMNETMKLYQSIAGQAVGSDKVYDFENKARPGGIFSSTPIISGSNTGFSGHSRPSTSPLQLIEVARRHLAEADAHLQMSLPLFKDYPSE